MKQVPLKIFEAHGPLATEGGCMITVVCKDANGKRVWTWYPKGEDGEESPAIPPGSHINSYFPFIGSAETKVSIGATK